MGRVILDTNVYFSALGFKGTPLEVVDFCFSDLETQVFHSSQTLDGLREKLSGFKLKQVSRNNLTDDEITNFLDQIESNSLLAEPKISVGVCEDPEDNKFLELVKEVRADYLITGDQDLLGLQVFEGTIILKPSEFLKQVW